jgi:hypothetical protein
LETERSPGSIALTAQDILDLLPPIPPDARVTIKKNSSREIKIEIDKLWDPLTLQDEINYFGLALTLGGETGNSKTPYEVVLRVGSLYGLQIVADLKAQNAPPLENSPSYLFFSALLMKLERFPWDRRAWFVVPKPEDGKKLWDRLGGFEWWGNTRRRKLFPVENQSIPATPAESRHSAAETAA